jgi:peptidoglycan/xylan/chitin deacetylase (PgdA/CDA1 family)
MKRLSLWAGVGALALAAIIYAACAGGSSQERAATPVPSRTPSSLAVGPPQVEAGAPIGDPTSERPKPEAKVVYVGPVDVPAVALTFDTGVQAGHVPEVLDILKEHGKLATFGITGGWAVTNPALLKRIVEEGHAVINHSWSHPSFTGEDTETEPLTADQIRDELARTEEKIQEIAGVSTKPYFRPPYGDFDRFVNQVVWEEGYEYNVLWLVDGLGWDGRSTKAVISVTLANAFNGAIFLYHTDNPREYKALEEIIEGLNERGLEMVTIPQLLGKEPLPTPTPTPTATPTATLTPTPTPAGAPAPSPPLKPAPAPPPAPPPVPAPATAPTPAPAPTPTPTPAYTRLAFDDFESGGTDGGSGWLGPWQSVGPFVTSGEAPHAGDWQLDLSSGVFVYRAADLAADERVHLRFWSRLSRLDASHQAIVVVSPGGGLGWEAVKEFTMAESDGMYHLYDIDLSGIEMSDSFAVGFYSLIDPLTDQWHVDDIELVTMAP